jgi:cytochrome P450
VANPVVSQFADISAILRTQDFAQALYDDGAVIMDKVLLTLHGDEHRRRRVLEFGVFRRNFFHWYEAEVFPKTLGETIAADLAAGRSELIDLGYRVTMNLTADFAGVDRPQRSAAETAALLRLVTKFSEGATLVHSTRDKEVVRAEVRDALEDFEPRFLNPSIARRRDLIARLERGEIGEDDLPRDVLTVILRSGDPADFPPDVLCREIAFYLQAGAHSTANSTIHAFHDVLTWCDGHREDAERIRTDPLFLQRCVHESIRLHPASPVSWRRAMCPVEVASLGPVSAGSIVELDLTTANRDTAIFGADADRFNPHRAIPTGHLPFGLSFGIGVHSCLGRDLDGGVVPRNETDPASHQYGIITLFLRRLFAEGARPDPENPPVRADHTARPNWGRYPIVFDEARRWRT